MSPSQGRGPTRIGSSTGSLHRWLGVDAQLTPTSDGGYLLAPQNPMDTAAQETMRTALTAVEDRTPGCGLGDHAHARPARGRQPADLQPRR